MGKRPKRPLTHGNLDGINDAMVASVREEAVTLDRAAVDRLRARLQAYMAKKGLRSTAQRRLIVDTFFEGASHMTIEDLLTEVRVRDKGIGYATVYRRLKLLKECGLADERHFDDGQARYEPTEAEEQHHDHIICERCGKIVEFNSDELEKLQERIARFLGFVVSRHRMELYGICAECREGRRETARAARGVHQV